MLERIFHLKENNTTVLTEVNAGLTTFFAMAYIIFLNPVILSPTGMDSQGVMIATCLAACVGTLICAFLSNTPFALAPAMGINSFFAVTLCSGTYGFTWQQALALTFMSGVLFFFIMLTPLNKVVDMVPEDLRSAISAGIGLFIATIGLINAGIIDMSTGLPALGDLKNPGVIIALVGVLLTAILVVLNVKAPLLWAVLLMAAANIITGQIPVPTDILELPSALGNVFAKMDFRGLLTADRSVITVIAAVLSLTFVDMFDTVGFLIGASAELREEVKSGPAMGRALISDALATIFGAISGTSTVTCFAESAAGISSGGRTGLTGVVTAIGFALAMFFSPLASVFTASVTSAVLIVVGLYMFVSIVNVDFKSMDTAIPVFITAIMMPMTYSISTGIGLGIISWTVCKLVARKVSENNILLYVLSVVFLVHFFIK